MEEVAKGRFVHYGISAEVDRAYREIERDFPRLRCSWDKENKEHIIVEYCGDGEHRLVLSSRTFQLDLIRLRLHRADSTKFDPLDEIEAAEAAVERAKDARLHEAIGDAGEKLAVAFAQDGLTVRPRMTPRSVKLRKARPLRNFEAPTRMVGNR